LNGLAPVKQTLINTPGWLRSPKPTGKRNDTHFVGWLDLRFKWLTRRIRVSNVLRMRLKKAHGGRKGSSVLRIART
jgi:hypothetical protein